ncbi:hypothetical protein GCM10018790_36340 [Kitasatospora xanthocidica]|uniref:hypothetical protein n=1 Tax=Kitasatospora xanthocidica TaxID=83382 RepID=UPI0016768A17|nr:hypothetical protein [Kitasatospora xanthocidica]GHF55076.1 hypothetical protein GCM10018790_36340 [Kitasatospora xanthocidica]
MTTPPSEPPAQLGLLDLSVDLSVPQVYSGTDFTVYLHIKNPFSVPVWIDKVDMSLPTQLFWRTPERPETPEKAAEPVLPEAETARLTAAVQERQARIRQLEEESAALPPERAEEAWGIQDEIALLHQANVRDQARLDGADDQLNLHISGGSTVDLHGRARQTNIHVAGGSTVAVFADRPADRERVPLIGSLPRRVALEPGSTDVWTIRLGTPRNPFFVPASYRLQLNVVYGLVPEQSGGPLPGAPGSERRRVFANTTALTVPLKAALWNVMTGGVAGGLVGSLGRSLQEAQSLSALAHQPLGTTLGSLVLAVILTGAAIVFAARKSEAPSFVTVEDFWGGVLVGFLIGYSGTAAFTELTGLPA